MRASSASRVFLAAALALVASLALGSAAQGAEIGNGRPIWVTDLSDPAKPRANGNSSNWLRMGQQHTGGRVLPGLYHYRVPVTDAPSPRHTGALEDLPESPKPSAHTHPRPHTADITLKRGVVAAQPTPSHLAVKGTPAAMPSIPPQFKAKLGGLQ
jgi:hypothetical protein